MARSKFETLTQQMFYILLCLQNECCGVDIMKRILDLTDGQMSIGPGTLYSLFDNFVKEGIIRETKVENRRKSYIITKLGKEMLDKEYNRLLTLTQHYKQFQKGDNNE